MGAKGRQRRSRYVLGIIGVLALVTLAVPAQAGAGSGSPVVVSSGLNSPRGLALGAGSLFIAEAGKGGSGPCGPGPLGNMCVGRTGHVTQILGGEIHRLANLSSIALTDGSFAFGPHDVAVASDGSLFATIGLAGSPETRDQFGRRGRQLATLVHVTPSGDVSAVADLVAYEAAHNPDGGNIESDPYGLLRLPGGRNIVTDAAGNDLLQVLDDGTVSTLAVFPDRLVEYQGHKIPMQAVPTSVVRGPDGAFYVGQLTGFPFPIGGARVYRVVPGQRPKIYARGFTNIIDIAFDRSGNLYVLEIAHNSLNAKHPAGALIRLSSSGERDTLISGLFFPTSVALAGQGKVFLTNCGVCPGGGAVLKLQT